LLIYCSFRYNNKIIKLPLGIHIVMLKKLSCLLVLLLSISSYANEKKPEKETTVFNETFSWQAQLGVSLQYADTILAGVQQNNLLNISLLFDFYYKGFFIQSDHRRADTRNLGAEIGYQLLVDDNWELDIITKSYIKGIYVKNIIREEGKDIPILSGLENRGRADGIGLRYSRYFDDNYLSIDVANLSPLSDANGWIFDSFYSHLAPYRNWDVYFNAGLTFYSESVMDYYLGIDQDEVTELRTLHRTDAGYRIKLEALAQYPISESWTFNIGIGHSYYSSNVKESPIVDSQNSYHAMVGVLYVF